MSKVLAIDPGISKCGLIIADMKEKKFSEALVIKSNTLLEYVKKICQAEGNIQLIIGNGTSSRNFIKSLKELFPNVIIVDEKNSTLRAKERYFEIFPLNGIQFFLPREIFILNKNLDALAALIILEDYYKCKLEASEIISTKTWLK